METSTAYILVCVGYIIIMCAATFIFIAYRRHFSSRLGNGVSHVQELRFHSPDDQNRRFMQKGFKFSFLGRITFYGWLFVPVAAYALMIFSVIVSYLPDWMTTLNFADWYDVAGVWVFSFLLSHIAGAVVIKFYAIFKVYTLVPETLALASYVLIEEEMDKVEVPLNVEPGVVPRLKELLSYVSSPSAFRTVVPVQIQGSNSYLEFTCVRYSWNSDLGAFYPVGLMENPETDSLFQKVEDGGLTFEGARKAHQDIGPNAICVRVPSVMESVGEEFGSLIYVYQSLGAWTYIFYSTWNVGSLWVILIVGAGLVKSLAIVRRNQQKIADLAKTEGRTRVLRGGAIVELSSMDVVLGDLVVVDEDMSVPCDGALMDGAVVVNESMLTGEPMPIQKIPVSAGECRKVDPGSHKKHFLYAGTKVLQSTGKEGGKALMVATGIGSLTTKGQLVRMVLFPTAVRFKYNDQIPVVYTIMFLYAVILMVILLIWSDIGNWVATFLALSCVITQSLSPMMPVSLVMGQSVAAKRLNDAMKVTVLSPGRIPIAGKISLMVFDKTGTITKEGMDFVGVQTIKSETLKEQSFESITHWADGRFSRKLRDDVLFALASCHTVTSLRNGSLVGNQVEVSMFQTCGWELPCPGGPSEIRERSTGRTLEVLKLLDFDHRRMTSGAIVMESASEKIYVFMKGSYEKVAQLIQSSGGSLPVDYEHVTSSRASENFYVLGIACQELTGTKEEVTKMTRDQIELGSGMAFRLLGLLLFKNEMKSDSPEALKRLRDGGVRSVICTGDNALTAIAIAKQTGLVSKHSRVLLGDVAHGSSKEEFVSWKIPGDEMLEIDPTPQADDELAVTVGAWRHLLKSGKVENYWRNLRIFARMKPEDKVNVIKFFQSDGNGQNDRSPMVVGMCGDGGNDCGALRAAHAGLALSEEEASMVAPFSSGRDGKSLLTVVDMVRYGRACLATNLATFTLFIVYAFVLTFVKVYLTLLGNFMLSEWVWITTDIVVGIGMIWTMTLAQPSETLSSYRPSASLLGPRTLLNIAFPVFSFYLVQLVASQLLWDKSWYYFVNTLDLSILPRDWMKKGDNHDTPVAFYFLLTAMTSTAYIMSFGGAFRANVLKNWTLNLVYALMITGVALGIWTQQNDFTCVFRVSCDMVSSMDTDVPVVNQWSVGDIGGCFMGSQLHYWQTAPGADPTWTPTDDETLCLPPAEVLSEVPEDSPKISTNGCTGPNNCYDNDFKMTLTLLLLSYVIANVLFVKYVMLGPVSAIIRRRQRSNNFVHL